MLIRLTGQVGVCRLTESPFRGDIDGAPEFRENEGCRVAINAPLELTLGMHVCKGSVANAWFSV